MKYTARILALFAFPWMMSGLNGCAKHEVDEAQARQLAVEQIERVQSVLNIDSKRLPPLLGTRTPEGFEFEVRDKAQNISIVIHVTKTGLAELSSLSLDEEQRRHEAGIQKAEGAINK